MCRNGDRNVECIGKNLIQMANNPNIKAIHARQKARKKLVQALYQWLLNATEPLDIIAQFETLQPDFKKIDQTFFKEILFSISKEINELKEELKPFINIAFNEIDPVEQAILLIAVVELKHHPETPYRVIINESIELAKRFGATDSHKFINGVVDKLSKHLRPLEVQ